MIKKIKEILRRQNEKKSKNSLFFEVYYKKDLKGYLKLSGGL